MLGIDPDSFTIDDHGRPTWKGSITLTDPADPKPAQHGHDRDQRRAPRGRPVLPRRLRQRHPLQQARQRDTAGKPAQRPAIGEMVLNGWIGALQEKERERQSTLDGLINTAGVITNDYNGATEEALHKLAVRVTALKPGDLPEPYNKSLAKVTAALAKASQRVEARLKANADYAAAATNVKIRPPSGSAATPPGTTNAAPWPARSPSTTSNPLSSTRFATPPSARLRPPSTKKATPVLATEEIYTLQSPLDIANEGQAIMVNALDYKASPTSSSSARSSTAGPSSTPRRHLPSAQEPTSITHAGSGRATTTPTSRQP